MSVHRYDRKTLIGDFIKAGSGGAVAVFFLVIGGLPDWLAIGLGATVALFLVYLVRTALKQRTMISFDGDLIVQTVSGFAFFDRQIPVDQLTNFDLKYFSTRRDGENGWWQLKLEGTASKISVESDIEGFDDLIGKLWDCSRLRGLATNRATLANVKALGLLQEE